MKEPAPLNCSPVAVLELHQLYCQLTAQKLSLRFDRERLWYEFLCAGFSAADLEQTIAYLQREIRAQRRNIGALKLSNLLQLDRFEEDLNISRVRLRAPAPKRPAPPSQSPSSAPFDEQQHRRMLQHLREFRKRFCNNPE
jgi:hypothetical protein